MSIPLETIYSYFESGDLPTQEQFRDSWSSFWHKDESILPSNVATVDKGGNNPQSGNVYTKTQADDLFMSHADYTDSSGKILAEKIEALGLTTIIEAVETTISDFAANSNAYQFENNDFIAILVNNGNYTLYIFKGGEKRDKKNYLPTGMTNVTMGMVEGLQTALNEKMNKPAINGNFFVRNLGPGPIYATISPATNYLLQWDGNNFKESNVYNNAGKLGIDTTSPTEALHLNNGRVRSKAYVLDENNETLMNQITSANKKLLFTDSGGAKKTVLMTEDFPAEFLKLPSLLTPAQKEKFGTDWNNQYSNGSLNVYGITPTVIKNDHIVNYLVLQGLNLNINPASTSVRFIPVSNATGVGEIDCLGFQTVANGQTMIVSVYGDSLQAGTQYNLMLRTSSPMPQVHRTTSSINIVNTINSIDVSKLKWETKAYTGGQEGSVFTTNGGMFNYNSNVNNKAYAYEPNVIVGAAKSEAIFGVNSNFYLEMNLSLSMTGVGVTEVNDFYGYLGLLQNNMPLALADNSFLRVINASFRSGGYQSMAVWNNTMSLQTKIEPGAIVLNANIVVMRQGNVYTQFLTVGNTTKIQSITSTTEAISLSLAVSNGSTPKSINCSIVQAFTF